MKNYLHGSNEINYQKFICSCCGKKNQFGKVICLVCRNKIIKLEDKIKLLRQELRRVTNEHNQ